ncbi:hypothetical protein NPIL_548101 [Nephila pilipes]|uniref:Uncharacterized protein n=1 Tax=Nephila pilipes TaxID=299642 RepID=A0A8X6PU61_NEPPI|nr:hypothetical protein NPIL_548101 [Nephila pilipes]
MDFSSECFLHNPTFGDQPPSTHKHDSSDVLGGETKRKLRVFNLYSDGKGRKRRTNWKRVRRKEGKKWTPVTRLVLLVKNDKIKIFGGNLRVFSPNQIK